MNNFRYFDSDMPPIYPGEEKAASDIQYQLAAFGRIIPVICYPLLNFVKRDIG